MIANFPIGILFCPTVLDLTSLAGKSDAKLSSEVSERLTEIERSCTKLDFKKRVHDLAEKTGEMSNQQMLRLLAWARCICRCVNESIFWHSFSRYLGDWSTLRFEIDPVQQNGGSEAEVFDFMLRQWIIAWCQEQPLMIARETLTPDHPFMKNWNTPNGVDAKKMFDNNIHYVPSDKSKGIQLADMTATIIRRAVLNSSADNLFDYGMLMTRTLGDPRHAAGVYFFGTPGEREAAEVRYRGVGDQSTSHVHVSLEHMRCLENDLASDGKIQARRFARLDENLHCLVENMAADYRQFDLVPDNFSFPRSFQRWQSRDA